MSIFCWCLDSNNQTNDSHFMRHMTHEYTHIQQKLDCQCNEQVILASLDACESVTESADETSMIHVGTIALYEYYTSKKLTWSIIILFCSA